MMHYVSFVNHRRDFVEEMCFKKSIVGRRLWRREVEEPELCRRMVAKPFQ